MTALLTWNLLGLSKLKLCQNISPKHGKTTTILKLSWFILTTTKFCLRSYCFKAIGFSLSFDWFVWLHMWKKNSLGTWKTHIVSVLFFDFRVIFILYFISSFSQLCHSQICKSCKLHVTGLNHNFMEENTGQTDLHTWVYDLLHCNLE